MRTTPSQPSIHVALRRHLLRRRGVGVVVTGTLGDGASGLWALKEAGGIAVIQDPSDVAFPEMPETALSRLQPDHVVHLADLPGLPLGETAPRPSDQAT